MTTKSFLYNINLNKNEIKEARLEVLATAPNLPGIGQIYFNSTDSNFYGWNGSLWRNMSNPNVVTTNNSETKITGRLGINISGAVGAFVDIQCSSNVIGARIRGASGQTQDLLQVQSSSGSIVGYWDTSGSLKANNITTNLTGTGSRLVQADNTGLLSAPHEILETYISNPTIINILTDTSNWSNKVYIGPGISGVYAGQIHVGNDYLYYFKTDTSPIRLAIV